MYEGHKLALIMLMTHLLSVGVSGATRGRYEGVSKRGCVKSSQKTSLSAGHQI